MVDVRQPTVMEHGGSVVDVIVPVHESDNGRNAAGIWGEAMQTLHIGRDELGLEKKVFRWIAGNRQLGEGDQVNTHCSGAVDALADPLLVAVQITYRGVNLGQSDAQLVHSSRVVA